MWFFIIRSEKHGQGKKHNDNKFYQYLFISSICLGLILSGNVESFMADTFGKNIGIFSNYILYVCFTLYAIKSIFEFEKFLK